jgi:uncharacterized membrane protein
MFEEIFGLPAHPLIVHMPVVLVPITALLALGYGLIPPLRRTLGWLLVLSSIAAAVGAVVAVESGEAFAKHLGGGPTGVEDHSEYGETVRNLALLLAVVAIVLVSLDAMRRGRARRAAANDPARGSRRSSGGLLFGLMSLVLTLALLGLAGGATWSNS